MNVDWDDFLSRMRRRKEEIEEELKNLSVIWNIELSKKALFLKLVMACYSFILIHRNLTTIPTTAIAKIRIMKELTRVQLETFLPILRGIVPNSVSDDAFNRELIVIVEYLDERM